MGVLGSLSHASGTPSASESNIVSKVVSGGGGGNSSFPYIDTPSRHLTLKFQRGRVALTESLFRAWHAVDLHLKSSEGRGAFMLFLEGGSVGASPPLLFSEP